MAKERCNHRAELVVAELVPLRYPDLSIGHYASQSNLVDKVGYTNMMVGSVLTDSKESSGRCSVALQIGYCDHRWVLRSVRSCWNGG